VSPSIHLIVRTVTLSRSTSRISTNGRTVGNRSRSSPWVIYRRRGRFPNARVAGRRPFGRPVAAEKGLHECCPTDERGGGAAPRTNGEPDRRLTGHADPCRLGTPSSGLGSRPVRRAGRALLTAPAGAAMRYRRSRRDTSCTGTLIWAFTLRRKSIVATGDRVEACSLAG
jgi:hypothetical protein